MVNAGIDKDKRAKRRSREGGCAYMGQTKRIVYFDLLTIASTFAVVVMHCNGMVHTFVPNSRSYLLSLAVEVLFYFAVPVFFMLTGANNMTYRSRHTTRSFLVRRAKRLVVPYLAWSLIFYVLRFGIERGSAAGLSVYGFWEGLMGNAIEPVFWFFPVIIAVTLAMPVLSLLIGNRRVLWYIVGATAVLQFTLPPLLSIAHLPWNGAFAMPVATPYVAYAVLGYLLATGDVPHKARVALYAGGAACLAIRFGYTLIASNATGVLDRLFFDYGTFTALVPSAALFVLAKQKLGSREFSPRFANAAKTVSGCAFGVYLVHKIFLDDVLLRGFGLPMDSLFLRFVCPFIVFAVSLAVVYAMKRVPGLRAIVP